MALGDGVTWNESVPDNSTLANQIDDYQRDLAVGVRSRMAREHVWPSSHTGTNSAGNHTFITLQQQTGAPSLSTALTQVGALYVGSSGSGYPLTFEHSDGTTVTLVNSAKNIPVVTTGTQGSILICSSANANSAITLAGSADGYVLLTHSNTAAPTWGQVSAGGIATVPNILGAWVDKSASYGAQQAATDGFVIAKITLDGSGNGGDAYTDSSANPTTVRGSVSGNATISGVGTITMPVKKNDYWKIVSTGGTISSVYWIPLGV